MDVASLDPVAGMGRDPDDEIEVSRGTTVAAGAALPPEPDALTVGDPRRDGDVEGPLAARTGDADRAPGPGVGLLDPDLDLDLLVGAGNGSPAATLPAGEQIAEQVLQVELVPAGPDALASGEVAGSTGAGEAGEAPAEPPARAPAGRRRERPVPAPSADCARALAQVCGSTPSGTCRKSGPNASYRRLVSGSERTSYA